MSGHASFAPIGANRPVQNIVLQPQVAQPANPGMPGNGEGMPGNVERGAGSLVKELDVLLAKASASAAARGVDTKGALKVAGDANLPKAVMKNLQKTAKKAIGGFKAIDSFTGATLAKAMCRKEDGTIDWDPKSEVGRAVQTALDAQAAFSEALGEAINSLPETATADQQAALEEAKLQCDRRIAEIETIVLQITEIAAHGDEPGQVDEAAKARLFSGKVGNLASEGAVSMHDRDRALAALNDSLSPLLKRLDGFSANAGATATPADFRAFTREIATAQKAIAAAAKSGKLEYTNPEGKKIEVFVDRTFLDEAAKLVDEAAKRLAYLRKTVACAAMERFVLNDFPWLGDGLFKGSYVREFRYMGSPFDSIGDFIEMAAAVKKAALDYARDPSQQNETLLDYAVAAFDPQVCIHAARALVTLANPYCQTGADASASFTRALKTFQHQCQAKPKPGAKGFAETIAKSIINNFSHIEIFAEHVKTMGKTANSMDEKKFLSSGALRAAFRGEKCFTTIVESRIHGYDDDDINPDLDDTNVASRKQLGSGAFNTVSLVTFKNGSQYVFKPELAGRLGAGLSPLQTNLQSSQQMVRINACVQKTADALGLGDVMVKTTAGVSDGQFGMYMEKAKGVEAATFVKGGGSGDSLNVNDIHHLDAPSRTKVNGRLMRQLNRLLWFDTITGQGDRHKKNYLVDVRPDLTVSIKGIDNDASFGVFRTGLQKFHLATQSHIKRLNSELAQYSKAFGGNAQDVLATLKKDPAFKYNSNGTIDVDLSKCKNPVIAEIVCHKTLGGHTFTVPQEIDRDLYDHLMTLKSGEARDAYLGELQKRLGAGSAQYQAAVSRLDESIAHAEKLEREGKVYSAEDWEKPDVQKSVASAKNLAKSLPPVNGYSADKRTDDVMLVYYNYTTAPNLYLRDFAEILKL